MKGFRRTISMLLALSCREAAELMSRQADGDLTRTERWALWLHLLACRASRRYRRQLRAIRETIRDATDRLEAGQDFPGPPLPDTLRERLRALADTGQG